jgi:hypothetical protein
MTTPAEKSPGPGLVLFWVLMGIAAACAFAAVWLNLRVATLRTELEGLTLERDLADVTARTAQTRLRQRSLLAEGMINDLSRQLRARDALAKLSIDFLDGNEADGSVAVLVLDPEARSGLLASARLAANRVGEDYMIWSGQPAGPFEAVASFHVAVDGAVHQSFAFPDQAKGGPFFVSVQAAVEHPGAPGRIVLAPARP